MATKVFLFGVKVVLLFSILLFATMPTRSASSTASTETSSPSPAITAINVYAGKTAENCTSHGASHGANVSGIPGETDDSGSTKSENCRESNKNSDAANPIPPSFDAPFGSYPNLLKITKDERDSFSPVVFFQEPRRNGNVNDHVAVKDHRRSSGELASIEAIERKRVSRQKNDRGRIWKLPTTLMSSFARSVMGFVGGRLDSETLRADDHQHWAIGKYDENRDGGMYESDLFDDLANTIDGYGGRRTVHLGMDLGGPVGTPVHAFSDGIVHSVGYNPDLGDYGYVIVVEHFWGETGGGEDGADPKVDDRKRCWALYGHLDESTLTSTVAIGEDDSHRRNRWWTRLSPSNRRRSVPVKAGDFVRKGAILGRMGDIDENGGWIKPHLHFQLSTKPPDQPHDMPGASSVKDRAVALQQYPDPRYVLGPLY